MDCLGKYFSYFPFQNFRQNILFTLYSIVFALSIFSHSESISDYSICIALLLIVLFYTNYAPLAIDEYSYFLHI